MDWEGADRGSVVAVGRYAVLPPPVVNSANVFAAGGVGTMSYEHRSLHEPAIL